MFGWKESMVLVTVDEKQVANQLRWEIFKQFDIDNIIGLIRFREFMYLYDIDWVAIESV